MFVINIEFNKNVDYGIAQQLHGFIYEKLGFILEHKQNTKDFIQFVELEERRAKWFIIPNEKYKMFFEVFVEKLENIELKNYNAKILNRKEIKIKIQGQKHKINFVSPFFFKNSRTQKYEASFNSELLIRKLARYSDDNFLEISKDFEKNITITNVNLKPCNVNFFKTKTLALKGEIELEYRGDNLKLYNVALYKLILEGYGVKSALGFGGVIVENL